MEQTNRALSRRLKIKNELGLHARPAAKIAELAKTARSPVWIVKDGEKIDAASVMDILTLACFQGTEILVQIENKADLAVLEGIGALVDGGFGE
jgi:phosphocarrier protein HPr